MSERQNLTRERGGPASLTGVPAVLDLKSACLAEAVSADRRLPAEAGPLAVDHFDTFDEAVAPAQIEGPGLRADPDDAANGDVIRLAIAIHDAQVEHLDIIVARREPDGAEPPIAPADADHVPIAADERHLLAAELNPRLGRTGRGAGWRHRPSRLAEDLDDGLAAEIGARPVDHLDPLDVAALTPEVERQRAAPPDQLFDAQVLGIAVEIDEPDRHHEDIVALGDELQGSERTCPVPVLGLADVDDVAVDQKADRLFGEQR